MSVISAFKFELCYIVVLTRKGTISLTLLLVVDKGLLAICPWCSCTANTKLAAKLITLQTLLYMVTNCLSLYIQWNLYLSFPDNSFSRICRSISMVPEGILFQPWLPHLLFSRIHCFFFRPPMKTMNRGFTVFRLLFNSIVCRTWLMTLFKQLHHVCMTFWSSHLDCAGILSCHQDIPTIGPCMVFLWSKNAFCLYTKEDIKTIIRPNYVHTCLYLCSCLLAGNTVLLHSTFSRKTTSFPALGRG
jgi:hypothetical protein